VNRLSIGREYGFHSSTGRELSPLGGEQKLSPLDKKSSKFANPGIGIVSKGLTGDRKIKGLSRKHKLSANNLIFSELAERWLCVGISEKSL
jgi:hypothetical protein